MIRLPWLFDNLAGSEFDIFDHLAKSWPFQSCVTKAQLLFNSLVDDVKICISHVKRYVCLFALSSYFVG